MGSTDVSAAHAPILVIDSSLAGLNVVRALRDRLPEERFAFFADLARSPYAYRSPERIQLFVRQILKRVERVAPKLVLLACDVCCAVTLATLRQELFPIAVTGVIDAAARAAVEPTGESPRPTIGIFAGNWTIEQRVLERAIFRRRTKCQLFFRATPALDAIINEGRSVEDPLLLLAAEQYTQQLTTRGCETILLANTALSTIRRTLQLLVGPEVNVVDAARATAEEVARRLTRAKLLRPPSLTGSIDPQPIQWFLTDESPELFDRAERLAGFELPPPTIVGLDEFDAVGNSSRMRHTG